MNESLLKVKDLTMQFGGVTALHKLSFVVNQNEICGLIGPNGAGKTTLFNVISRIYDPTAGSVHFQNTNLLSKAPYQIAQMGISRTFQNLALWPKMTVLENVLTGAHVKGKQNFFSSMLRIGLTKEEQELQEQQMRRAVQPPASPAHRDLHASFRETFHSDCFHVVTQVCSCNERLLFM